METKQKDMPFTFGKYNGILICDIPNSYLNWIVGEQFFKNKYKELYEQVLIELKYRKQFDIDIKENKK